MKNEPLLRSHMPELDMIRGIAVLGVLFFHSFGYKFDYRGFHGLSRLLMHATVMGKLGVNMFFVLSGFLITGILLSARNKPNYYGRFYYRRALRILPPHLAIILALIIYGITWKFAVLSLFFMSNFTELFGVENGYGPLWSLAVEEHFYLLWPLAVRRLRSIALIAAFLCIAVPMMRFTAMSLGWVCRGATWLNCDGLALGAILQLCLRRWPERNTWRMVGPTLMATAIGGILVMVPLGMIGEPTDVGYAVAGSLWNLLFAGFLASMLVLGTGPWRRFSTLRPLVGVGYISYGLYLYHMFVCMVFDGFFPHAGMFVRCSIVIPASFAVAWISRRFYEESFLQLKDRAGLPVAPESVVQV